MSAWDWSVVPDLNATADVAVGAQDGASARGYPGLIRAIMTAVRAVLDDTGGALVTTGTANAYTAATRSGVSKLRAGISLLVQADRDNTAECTLNVDGTGPKPWRQASGADMVPAVIKASRFYRVAYDEVAAVWRTDSPAVVVDDVTGLSTTLSSKAGIGRKAVADANYAAVAADVYIGIASLTAARTITLPPASGYPAGQTLFIADETGACSSGTPIMVAAAGTDSIAGSPAITMASGYQKLAFHSNGSNLWTFA